MTTIQDAPLPARTHDWLVLDKIRDAGGSLHVTELTYQERVSASRLIRCGVVRLPGTDTATFAVAPHVDAWLEGYKARADGQTDARANPYEDERRRTADEYSGWRPARVGESNPHGPAARGAKARHDAWADGYAGRPHTP